MPRKKPATTVWISALIPARGADCYEGVRVQASLTEQDCYRDLHEWLQDGDDYMTDFESVASTAALLSGSEEVQLWKVEEQSVVVDMEGK